MPKHVGITSDPERRKAEKQREYPTLHNWDIVRSGLNYEQAQAVENEYTKRAYKGHPGGEKKSRYAYSVYTFET